MSPFVFSAAADVQTQTLSLSFYLLIKTDPPVGRAKAKLIIPEMGYMSIFW